VVLALREMGYDAWLVALRSSEPLDDKPVILASMEDLRSATWWKDQRPDAVVLNTWSAFRYDAIRRAALAATPRTVERLDTDGMRSARLFPRQLFVWTWASYRDKFPAPLRWLAGPLAWGRIACLYFLAEWTEARMVRTMRQMAGLIVESPIAGERMQRMIKRFSNSGHRMEIIPHPVNEKTIEFTKSPKENRIITVGRWASAQKDFPLLHAVLKRFLQSHPDWEATVVGGGVPAGWPSRNEMAEEWGKRITYHEKLTHQELGREYSRAKIYLMVSRYESFCIAAAEALCCGASVVGSCAVPSSYYFAETCSGTVAGTRTREGFLEALDVETGCWTRGERNPHAIALTWRNRAGSHAVARATLTFLEETVPSDASG
jgi:glycosyltransferase involved in cell wall biosynthesis